jgi:hypothetical protein
LLILRYFRYKIFITNAVYISIGVLKLHELENDILKCKDTMIEFLTYYSIMREELGGNLW